MDVNGIQPLGFRLETEEFSKLNGFLSPGDVLSSSFGARKVATFR